MMGIGGHARWHAFECPPHNVLVYFAELHVKNAWHVIRFDFRNSLPDIVGWRRKRGYGGVGGLAEPGVYENCEIAEYGAGSTIKGGP